VENPSIKPVIDDTDVDIESANKQSRADDVESGRTMTGRIHEFQSNRRRRFARADPALP
jgi:hypothetical protein